MGYTMSYGLEDFTKVERSESHEEILWGDEYGHDLNCSTGSMDEYAWICISACTPSMCAVYFMSTILQ